MQASQAPAVSKKAVVAGWVISGFLVLFMVFDSFTKMMSVQMVLDAQRQLGYADNLAPVIGAILLVFTIVYVVPRTAIIGAILITAYLGGAAASQLRAGNPPFQLLFPIIFCFLLWLGLWLRDSRLRTILP